MTTMMATKPVVVLQVTTRSPSGLHGPVGYDLRGTRLRIVAYLLGATVANLDCVRDARSLAHIEHRPACEPGPCRAA